MLSYGPEVLEEKMNMFLDILNTNGEVNIDWIREQKSHFDSIYKETKEYYDRFKRNKGKISKILDEENIPIPLYFDEYDMDDVKELINNQSIKDEVRKVNLHKLVNKLIVTNEAIKRNIDKLDNIIKQVSTKKGINNVDKLEADTFDEHYYDIDAIREERGIELPNKVVLSETFFVDDAYLQDTINYTFNGYISLKDLAREVYNDESYWTYIYNFSDNENIIANCLNTNKISSDMIDKIASDPRVLKGAKIKVPKEITVYTDEFDTKVLKKIKI